MSEIVNLRQARKARERMKARAQGDANAVKFGQSKAGKALDAAQARQARDRLDGHRREPDPTRRGRPGEDEPS